MTIGIEAISKMHPTLLKYFQGETVGPWKLRTFDRQCNDLYMRIIFMIIMRIIFYEGDQNYLIRY